MLTGLFVTRLAIPTLHWQGPAAVELVPFAGPSKQSRQASRVPCHVHFHRRRTTSIHLDGVPTPYPTLDSAGQPHLVVPHTTLSRPSFLLPIPSCEVAVARDCISTGQVPFPLPSPLPWSLFCTPFLPSWFCPRSISPVSRVVPVDRGFASGSTVPLCPPTTSLSHPCEA